MRKKIIEVTAQDIHSVKAAIEGGAERIELCTALGVAGLTPSIGLIEGAVSLAEKNKLRGFVDVLIRPRAGDFIYDNDEITTCITDIKHAVEAGVDGIVVGTLNKDGTVNKQALSMMIEAAGDTAVVFNRAFDVVENQFETLEILIEMGIVRILTSGGAPVTIEGIGQIEKLVKSANGRIEIMAGGGVRIEDIRPLFDVGVDAVHTSAKTTVVGGPNRPGERASYTRADPLKIKAAVEIAKQNDNYKNIS